ncbi:MAG: HAD hydrolase-like protein, partial [Firmicutes bacterium]|nr:HAD hydrolase-like protein [Bacillota bacterium]
MEKKYKIVLFDMDGTILDTLRDLSDSVNWALAECGLPQRTFAENRRFLGNGIINLIHRAVPEGTPEDLELQVRTVYKHHYEQHCNDTTKPFDGIPE